MKLKFNVHQNSNSVLKRYEGEQMKLTKESISRPLLQDKREALGILVENSNWLGPGKLQTIIEEYY